MSKVFANGLGVQSSIPGQVISKTQKMVLDSAVLNTQHYVDVWLRFFQLIELSGERTSGMKNRTCALSNLAISLVIESAHLPNSALTQ